jgi:AraC-like DNA-binding protein
MRHLLQSISMTERLFLRLDGDASHGPETTVPANTLRSFAAGERLAGHVAQILVYRETFSDGAEVTERVLPDGAVGLAIHFADGTPGEHQGGVAMGAATAPVQLRWRRSRVHSFSVALRPGAASALLGVPAGELQGMAVPLEALWGRAFAQLRERMAEQPDDAARVGVLRAALEQRLARAARAADPCAVQAAALLSASAGRMKPREAAGAVGLGERRLQQIFRAEIGMAPKAWSRIARLHACLRALRSREPVPSWAALAVDGGFYDQAHLANEFRALCGMSPTEFLARRVPASHSSKT